MSTSPTIIDEQDTRGSAEWLHNPHAGEHLQLDFLDPLDMPTAALARCIGSTVEMVEAVIDGTRRVDAELDLRLGRYFNLSEGFFLRLQNSYDLCEAKRSLNGELDRIIPHTT